MNPSHQILVTELEKLLNGGSAHAGLKDALGGLPESLRDKKPHNLPYSIWQLTEHIRITQWDMLEFCKDANHKSPKWPDEYWPKETAPADRDAWDNTVKRIDDDLEEFIELIRKGDLYKPLPHGDGQSILREALQMADHNAYHI